jgi:transposase
MWTPTTREQHSRKNQRYQSDLTDEEWCVIEPHLPKPRAKGRPRSWTMREIINGIFYVMRAGCTWRLLPSDFPPWGTIYRWFATFRDDGRFEAINHTLVMADRERVGGDASPAGAIIDSQSVKTTEAGGPRGYDAGKKINGRKRHALVDTDGRGVLEPHPASVQDRDGGGPLLRASRGAFPFIKKVFADSGYAGDRVAKATVIAVEIVRKSPDQVGFAVQPRRWVVERFQRDTGDRRRRRVTVRPDQSPRYRREDPSRSRRPCVARLAARALADAGEGFLLGGLRQPDGGCSAPSGGGPRRARPVALSQ